MPSGTTAKKRKRSFLEFIPLPNVKLIRLRHYRPGYEAHVRYTDLTNKKNTMFIERNFGGHPLVGITATYTCHIRDLNARPLSHRGA